MNTLDKEEFRIKLEEINHLVEQQDYKGAMNVVDSIDWRRVKNVHTLCVVGEIYAANKRYEDSKEIFLLAYHRAPIGKNILYRLIEVSLKMGDIDEAMEFFEEFMEVAPNDNTQYILKYKIYKAKRSSLNEQIKILEEYKEKEFTERWSYELAKLYYKAGDKEKCLDVCNEIVLWFSEGKYVMKALDLKMRMGALTGAEKEKYEQQFIPKLITPEEAKALKQSSSEPEEVQAAAPGSSASLSEYKDDDTRIDSIRINDESVLNSSESLQDKISKGIRDIFGGKKKDEEDESDEEGMSMEDEDVQEEMLRSSSSDQEYDNVPDLEPEGAKPMRTQTADTGVQTEKPDFSATMKMPELKIPESMKNVDLKDALVTPEIPMPSTVSGSFGETEEGADDKSDFSFNLEDTILAAASAQGIEIPDGPVTGGKTEPAESTEELTEDSATEPVYEPEEEQEENVSDYVKEEPLPPAMEEAFEEEAANDTEEDEDERDNAANMGTIPRLEEEEILTEEDLQQAEAEFLHGPAPKIPSLEPEEFMPQEIPSKNKKDLSQLDDDEFIANFLKQEVEKEGEEAEKNIQMAVQSVPKQAKQPNQSKQPVQEPVIEKKPLTEEEKLEQFIESIQPKVERDPLDIVPREKELSDDEKKLFTYFVKVPGMKEQLINTLCDVQSAAADKTSKTGNIIVMGGRETGKTRLISGLIPAICKELNLEASKVAYVFADQINGKDIAKIVGKLAGGFLVIENANQLTQETVDQLDKAMEFRTDGLTVIIEDEKIGMRKLIARFPKFAKKFTSMINIPVFTNDELVNFARVYTKENGYTIDQMGMLALYNLIGINQKEDEPMNIGAVKELVDTAIARSQGGIRKLKRNFSKKRTDRDGYIVLYEKDFS